MQRTNLDLNGVIIRMFQKPGHLEGSRTKVDLRLSPQSVPVLATHAELESILLNLALNARDATPDGGVLVIETAVIERGAALSRNAGGSMARPKARLRVTDTGTRAGAAATLRLSAVAFTVGQLDGTYSIETRHGAGTCVTVYLPSTAQPLETGL